VETVLGLLGFCLFIVCVIALAACISWLVVKVSPKPGAKLERSEPSP